MNRTTPQNPEPSPPPGVDGGSSWRSRYGEKHHLQRVDRFPEGILPPQRVRIYRRQNYYLLQWWDKSQKKTLNERVEGDLVEAVSRARRIDEQLKHFRSAGVKPPQLRNRELADRFVGNLARRADAGEIDVATAKRYQSAVRRFLDFAERPEMTKRYPYAANVDRDFQLALAAYLNNAPAPGSPPGPAPPMRGQQYVLDVVRNMYQWAADPDRGNLLPAGFRNPFVGRRRRTDRLVSDPIKSPDVTVAMAVEMIGSADLHQLSLLAPLLLFGLRPAELGWLFREHYDCHWLQVACVPELDYLTKGRRDKRFPVPNCVARLWANETVTTQGLIYVHRRVVARPTASPHKGRSLADLGNEYRKRLTAIGQLTAVRRRRERTLLMRAAGQLEYDHVEGEFRKLADALKWPTAATLKDLRHLFATSLEDAGVPEYYRRYFMGHAPDRAPIVVYTHLTEEKLHQHYDRALTTELAPIVAAIESRLATMHQ